MSSRIFRTIVGGVLLFAGASRPALAHDGHTDRAPWDACSGRSLGERCAWDDAAHDLHIGTCRGVVQSLVCVRNRPVLSAAETRVTSPGGGAALPYGSVIAALALLACSTVGTIAVGRRWSLRQAGFSGPQRGGARQAREEAAPMHNVR